MSLTFLLIKVKKSKLFASINLLTFLNPSYGFSTNTNKNIYQKKDYIYVSNTTNFTPYGKQDLLNIFYTILNNGIDNYVFYCPKEYKNCIEDVKNISKDEDLLTHLNNFVHPYYSFSSISTDISDTGEINLKINQNCFS